MARIGNADRRRLLAAMLLSFVATNAIDASSDEPEALRIPKAGQPTRDFYKAAGSGVKVIAQATPLELSRDDWLTMSVTITELLNAPDVEKPSLKAIPAFDSFQIDEGPELDPRIDPMIRDRRVFVYRLRPASEQVTLIPEIAFHYYDKMRKVLPNRPQDQFPKTYSNALTIRVVPPARPPLAAPTPLDVPSFASNLADGSDVLAASPSRPPVWVWLAALVAPPVLAVGWVVIWRRRYPDAAKLVLIKRNRAVRHALSAIARTKGLPTGEAVSAASTAVLQYLHERFELPPGAFTPREIVAHLRCTSCRADLIALAEDFFRECDDGRFAPTERLAAGIADEAEQLVIRLEDAA